MSKLTMNPPRLFYRLLSLLFCFFFSGASWRVSKLRKLGRNWKNGFAVEEEEEVRCRSFAHLKMRAHVKTKAKIKKGRLEPVSTNLPVFK